MGRSRLEQETTVVFNEAEDTATVWTFSARVQRLLKKRGWKGEGVEGPYFLPKTAISIRGNRPRRKVSEAAQAGLRKGLDKAGPVG